MTTRTYFVGILAGGLALLGTAACGDNIECGAGTVEIDGECVLASDACGAGATYNAATGTCEANCAAGTVLEGNECVPDGTVICETGTTYNTTTGKCDPDITGCAEGTVFVDGECIPYDDTLIGDIHEPDEDNGWDGIPGTITTPETGESVTVDGCITPVDLDSDGFLDGDSDLYLFSVPGQTLLEITVDGIGGLAGAFAVYPTDDDLWDSGWLRFGVNLVGDTSSRQVFLPRAGTYVLEVADSRQLMFADAVGSAETCYFMTIANVAIPTPTAYAPVGMSCSDGSTCTGDDGCTAIGDGTCGTRMLGELADDVHFYSIAVVDGDIMTTNLVAPSEGMSPGFVNSNLNDWVGNTGYNAQLMTVVDGMATGTMVVAVDHFHNISLDDVAYSLTIEGTSATAAPADGTTTTVTVVDDQTEYLFWFDVAAGEVVNLAVLSATAELDVDVYGPGGYWYDSDNDSTADDSIDYSEWFYFLDAGRYYIELTYVGEETTFPVDITRTHIVPGTMALDTTTGDMTLDTDFGYDWYVFDAAPVDWFSVSLTAVAGTWGDVWFDIYSGSNSGLLDHLDDFGLADTDDEIQRIVFDDSSLVLIRISDDDGAIDSDEHYDVVITDLNPEILGNAPDSVADVALAADATHYYIARADARVVDSISITGTDDTGASELLLSEVDGSGEMGTSYVTAEPLVSGLWMSSIGRGYLPFRIDDTASDAGTYDLNVIVDSGHMSYGIIEGTLPFTNICPGAGGTGVVHALGWGDDPDFEPDTDDGLSEIPIALQFDFDLYGAAVDDIVVGANGFLTTDAAYDGSPGYWEWTYDYMPNYYMDIAMIAPYWGHPADVVVCVLDEATKLTVQWTGTDIYYGGMPVQYQAVLHDDNKIDFIYGPLHDDVNGPGLIGVQDDIGNGLTVGAYYEYANPGTSYTLLPIDDPTPP